MPFNYPLKEPKLSMMEDSIIVRDSDNKHVLRVQFDGAHLLEATIAFAAKMAKEYEATFPGNMKLGSVVDHILDWDDVSAAWGLPIFDMAMFDPLELPQEKIGDATGDVELDCRMITRGIRGGIQGKALFRRHPDGMYLIAFTDNEGKMISAGR